MADASLPESVGGAASVAGLNGLLAEKLKTPAPLVEGWKPDDCEKMLLVESFWAPLDVVVLCSLGALVVFAPPKLKGLDWGVEPAADLANMLAV